MKEWLQGSSDMAVGSVGLVLFVAFCFAAGKVVASFKSSRFTKAWAPLVPVIQGTVVHVGGGASISWLTGTWQGRRGLLLRLARLNDEVNPAPQAPAS